MFHPRQRFCGAVRVYGNTRVEQHPRMANCVYRRLRQAPIVLPDCQPHNPNQLRPARRGSSVLSGARGRMLDECLPRFFHAAISSRRPRLGIAIGSVCQDTEAVVAARSRICAAFKRGARISIAYSVQAVAQVKAINSSTWLLARRQAPERSRKPKRSPSLHSSGATDVARATAAWPSRSARTTSSSARSSRP